MLQCSNCMFRWPVFYTVSVFSCIVALVLIPATAGPLSSVQQGGTPEENNTGRNVHVSQNDQSRPNSLATEAKYSSDPEYDDYNVANDQLNMDITSAILLRDLYNTTFANTPGAKRVDILGATLKSRIDRLRNVENNQLELVFLVDSSASVGKANFFNELKFVKKVLADFVVTYWSTRVAVITFASRTRVLNVTDQISFPTVENHKCSLFAEELPNITYVGGGTYTKGAFENAYRILKKARKEATKAVFLITDGYSNGGDPRDVAEKLRANDVEIFTFGISNGNVRELYEMSSEPKHEHCYILEDFDEFESLARRALYEDLMTGDYIMVNSKKCEDQGCDSLSICKCGSLSGQYECVCPAGYFGTGLEAGCEACPTNTYKSQPSPGGIGTCLPCPQPYRTSPPGSTSLSDCRCDEGYAENQGRCVAIRCPSLMPPEHGSFINHQCSNQIHSACAVTCNMGYKLVGGSNLVLCTPQGTWNHQIPHCELKKCVMFPVPENSHLSCSRDDYAFDTVCNTTCDPGFNLLGSATRVCLPIAKWGGLNPICKGVTCKPKLPSKYGSFSPGSCSKESSGVGQECVFSCQAGYEVIENPSYMCLDTGEWDRKFDILNACKDIIPPTIVCPNDIYLDAQLQSNKARVENWRLPKASDNSNNVTISTLYRTINPPYYFNIGTNNITYEARDKAGNTAHCSFIVYVKDTQKPVVDRCGSPSPVLSPEPMTAVRWNEPKFSDNSGLKPEILSSHRPGDKFPWGTTVVLYRAADHSGNTKTCEVIIEVQETACKRPQNPYAGYADCERYGKGLNCTIGCKDGFSFAITPHPMYSCSPDGLWHPKNSMPWPDCSEYTFVQNVKLPVKLSYSTLNCDEESTEQIKARISSSLDLQLNQLCGQRFKCIISYIQAVCVKTEASVDALHSIRRRAVQGDDAMQRSDLDLQELADQVTHDVLNTNSSKSDPQVIVEIIINANHATPFASHSQTGEPEEFQNLATALDDVKMYLTFDMTNGILNITQGDGKVIFTQVEGVCPAGSVLKDGNKCVKCAKGTYYENGQCTSCGVGTYQIVEGSLSCQECPTNSSTLRRRSKNPDACKDICSPGTCSSTGLEQCESCGQGLFQPNANSTMCRPCPSNTTTANTGAVSYLNCIEQCEPGSVSGTGLVPCYPCPEGCYQSQTGAQYCDKCPRGSTTNSVGSTSMANCNVTKQTSQKPGLNVTSRMAYNECFKQPCKHDSTCEKIAQGFVCHCHPGFAGALCEINVNECEGVVCLNNGTCQDGINLFNCTCLPGFRGVLCDEDINECKSDPCQNQGRCMDAVNMYYCDCPEAYTGLNCEFEVNECISSPCANNGICSDEMGGFRCSCPAGYFGDRCQLDINECESTPCESGGTCQDQVNSFSCICPDGLEGDRCQINSDDCLHRPCVGGAKCRDLTNDFECLCRPGYGGKVCDIELPSNFSLSFEFTGITDYVLLEGIPDSDLSAITVAFWMQTSDTDNWGTAISYTVHNDSFDDLVLMDYTGWVIKVRNNTAITDLKTNDGRWHHIALTWISAGGEWHLYSDGEEVVQRPTKPLAVNDIIPGGGAFVIGQEQDTLRGGFSSREAFVGNISQLNMWDYALDAHEIAALATACTQVRGNVIAWPDVQKGMYGRVRSIPKNFCSGCPEPVVIEHGTVSGYVPSTPLQTITYSCDAGFKMTGLPRASCEVYDDWLFQDFPQCSKKYCGHPVFIDNGELIGDHYYFNDTIQYRCHNGYKLHGVETRWCAEDGEWDSLPPQCLEILCNKVPTISNGQVKFISQSQNRQGSTFNVSCNRHYRTEGLNTVSCQRNGHWTKMPRCRPLTCQPSIISDGYMEKDSSTVKVGDQVTYFCDEGFRMVGESVFICGTDQTFNGTVPYCRGILCSAVPSVPNSEHSPVRAEYHFSHTVQFTCIQGFNIEGVAALSCVDTDTWDGLPPRCLPRTCLPPDDIQHGQIIGSDFSFQHSITYECDSGYDITERIHRSCLGNGTWSNTVPKCIPVECPPPNQQNHLNIIGESFAYNDLVLFACDEGYWLEGERVLQCGADKQWNGTVPTCRIINCGKPPQLAEGIAHFITGHTYGSKMNYSCKEGYRRLKTGTNFTCGPDGTWIGELPSCNIISCHRPIIPIHGFMEGQNLTYGSIVSFSCEERYELSGNATITCGANGKWSSNVPVCLVTCDRPVFHENTIISSRGGIFTVNSTLAISCDRGQKLVGLSTVTCLKNGIWSGEPGRCTPIECNPPEILHGFPDALVFQENQTLMFQCVDGYQRVDRPNFICTHSGEWQGTIPTCELISCPNITNFRHGSMMASGFTYGSEVHFSCNVGYQLIGANRILCRSNGVWNPLIPFCNIVYCPVLPRLKNGLIQLDNEMYGSIATFSCLPGFRMNGPDKLTCLATSQWSAAPPVCVSVTCGQPKPLENGDFTVNGNVSYYCLAGYSLIGNSISICQNDGTWSQELRNCRPDTCPRPSDLSSGFYTPQKELYYFTDDLAYVCNQGYTLEGNGQQICGLNGKWTGGPVHCKKRSCPQPASPPNGSVRVGISRNGSQISQYACEEGYKLNGRSNITCSASGRWNFARQPQCIFIDCSLPPGLKNGRFRHDGTSFRSVATYICDRGYQLSGTGKKECLETAEWSRVQQKCLPVTCPRLRAPEHGNVDPPRVMRNGWPTARYSCSEGYTLVGVRQRECKVGGRWTGSEPKCNPIRCNIPPEIEHGRRRYDEDTLSSLTHYECDEGFRLRGYRRTRCMSSGRWKPEPPSCEIISCGVPDSPSHSIINYADGTYQDVVTYICDIGYILEGPTERSCSSDGSWTNSAPVCSAVKCPPPPQFTNASPLNPKLEYNYRSIVNFVCSSGFKLQGTGTIMCEASGTWNVTSQLCIAAECPLPSLSTSDKHLTIIGLNYSVGAVIKFSCSKNYQIHGPLSLQCDINGHWNDSFPTCTQFTCPTLNMTDGQVSALLNDISIVSFTCNAGFQINGVQSATCLADGIWSHPTPSCVKVESGCGPPPTIKNGHFRQLDTFSGRPEARYTCHPGYYPSGLTRIFCNHNNQWPGPPDCRSSHSVHPRQPICTEHCYNGGICVDDNVCQCVTGFIGERCQTAISS